MDSPQSTGIAYRLEHGSLLGMVRSNSIIDHDTDADVLVDATSLAVLEKLVRDPKETFFVSAQSHFPLSRRSLIAAASEQEDCGEKNTLCA